VRSSSAERVRSHIENALRSIRRLRFAVRRSFHRALVDVLVLVVLDDGGNGLEHVFVALFHRILQVEVLDRDVMGPNLKLPRTDLKSAFSIALRISSFLVRSPLTATTALSSRASAS